MISQLRRDYQALISSARWRWGNFLVRLIEILLFRKKQPLAVDHMNETLNRLEQKGHTAEKFNIPLAAPSPFHDSESIKMLNNWLRQLNNDYELLKNSMRWKLGNALIRFLELLAFRRKKTMAIDHLGQIFQEYQDESAGSRVQNTKKLKSWLRQAKNDFHAIRNSVRWRTGNRLVSIIDLLTFRWKKKTAMDHALKISAAYEDWAKNN